MSDTQAPTAEFDAGRTYERLQLIAALEALDAKQPHVQGEERTPADIKARIECARSVLK